MADAIRVFKFGGASVKDALNIRNVGEIIKTKGNGQLAVIVSAIGKTTNALEEVVSAFAKTKNEEATAKLIEVKQYHYEIARELLGDEHPIFAQLNDAFVEVEWLLEETFDQAYDYVYDQIVSIGEVASTLLICSYLQSIDLNAKWFDARGLIRTDELHREAWVDWSITDQLVKKQIKPALNQGFIAITQGFIGSTSDNETTTLGREGSDYSAAILSYCLDAESMSIWKDVPGVLTADPRLFDHVTKIDHLSYREAIEMTYYGAKVIHPKTIKPLQNKGIPLFVKSFLQPAGSGTRVDAEAPLTYPPIITVERDQALIQISTRDFSFVAEHHLKDLFNLIAAYRLQVNMMQNSAISFSISVNDQEDRIDRFAKALEDNFTCEIRRGLELTTVRHADDSIVDQQRVGKMQFMNHRVGNTVQMVLGELSVPVRKQSDRSKF